MLVKNGSIDSGKEFEWGRVSEDYAKFRDLYPEMFYKKLLALGVGTKGQTVLDIGTGTGVLPRNMAPYGAKWVGTDCSENQIVQAKRLAEGQQVKISFRTCPAEELNDPANSFDAITASQCLCYLNHARCAPKFAELLKPGGRFVVLYTAWLPHEDKIAGESEKIVLKYNPEWSGAGEVRRQMQIPQEYLDYFDIGRRELFDVRIPFSRESWHGRMRTCRGVGASMSEQELTKWEKEHKNMLLRLAPETFDILHYITYTELTVK